jgi:putative protease
LEALQELGCAGAVLSAEITPAQARDLRAQIGIGAMVYGRLALMLCRNCPVKAKLGCKACGNGKSLVDRRGAAFPVRCEGACAKVYNSRPLWLADVQDRLPPLGFRVYAFTTETREECARILRAYQNGEASRGEFTRGWLKS